MKKTVRFAAVKLLVMIIVDAVALICGFIANFVIGSLPIESDNPASVVRAVGIISAFIASAVFFGYTYRNVIKMKSIDCSPTVFSLKETAVYALFLAPLAVFGACGYELDMLSGALGIVYAPHCVFAIFGLNPLLNAVIYIILFALLNYAAAIIHKRKLRVSDTEKEPEKTDSVSDQE